MAQGVGVEEVKREEASPPLSLWQNRDFMILWSGQVVSSLGSRISGTVLPLLVLALTGSPLATGFGFALGLLPNLFLSLVAGALVDRWNRKLTMVVSDTLRVVLLASITLAVWLDAVTLWHIYLVILLDGTLGLFFGTAQTAALPRVVPKSQLTAASGQNYATESAVSIAGPALGTFLYASVGRVVPFLFDTISYFVSVISLLFTRADFQLERPKAEQRNLIAEIGEGLGWLWRQPVVRSLAFLTMGVNFVNAANALLVIIKARELGADEAAIGIPFSLMAGGAIVGAAIATRLQARFGLGRLIVGLICCDALIFPLLLFAPNLIILGLIYALYFVAMTAYAVVQFGYRLTLIPDRLQGRVNSSNRLFSLGIQPISAALCGLIIERLGGFSVAVIFYSVVMVLCAVGAALNPLIRNASSESADAD